VGAAAANDPDPAGDDYREGSRDDPDESGMTPQLKADVERFVPPAVELFDELTEFRAHIVDLLFELGRV
jgi:hypothetical protein